MCNVSYCDYSYVQHFLFIIFMKKTLILDQIYIDMKTLTVILLVF